MAAARAGRLRASFHLYNTEADVDAALQRTPDEPVKCSVNARIEPVSGPRRR